MCGCNRGGRTPGPTLVSGDAGGGGAGRAGGPLGLIQPTSVAEIRRQAQACMGTCEFYTYLSDNTPGDRQQGYYWNYGYKYCRRFKASALSADPKAARWIDCVTLNLQRAVLSDCVPLGHNLMAIKQAAYASHARVYTECGICELDKTFIKQLRVAATPDSADLWTRDGLMQIAEALRFCFFRPYVFDMMMSRYRSWGQLDHVRLGADLARSAMQSAENNYRVILGIMEMLSNSFDDDDVAVAFCRALSDAQLDTLAASADGRRILFVMKSALESGSTWADEQAQLNRINPRCQR